MSPEEWNNRLIKDIYKIITCHRKEDLNKTAKKISILFADEILNQYENRFRKITRSETVARLVLTIHWQKVKKELIKKLKKHTNG